MGGADWLSGYFLGFVVGQCIASAMSQWSGDPVKINPLRDSLTYSTK
jgi:hypothetical protein